MGTVVEFQQKEIIPLYKCSQTRGGVSCEKTFLPDNKGVRSPAALVRWAFFIMSKDPAMLWYWNDWYSGTTLLTRHQKGCYMDLLHAQFNNGHLHETEIKQLLGEQDFAEHWPFIRRKFSQDQDGFWFNQRLEDEQIKRQKFTESRRRNLKPKEDMSNTSETYVEHMKPHTKPHMVDHMDTHMDSHMENENENRNTDIIDNRKLTKTREEKSDRVGELFEAIWAAYGKKGNKQTALAKFRRLKTEEMKAIMAHIEPYVKNHKDAGKLEFLPHFTTYLNQRRWDDELPYQQKTVENIDWNKPKRGWFD